MSRQLLDTKHVGETISQVFDFTSQLAVSETISTATTTATVYSGTDATPSGLISGAASISGAKVTQMLTDGTLGVTYLVVCTITTSTGQTLKLQGFVVITPQNF